ncbi:MAG TPA: ABC transporter substrate-binding protein [Dehalococcoidia bacterium]|nr:ABC transporter substrate-binding protein [Dehalococcoidia bacterium]
MKGSLVPDRRNLIRLLPIFVAAALLVACAPAAKPPASPAASSGAASPPKDVLKLKVGVATSQVPALPNSVLWLAKDLGFYAKEGLDVDVVQVQSTPSVITAMRTGDLDVGNIATSDMLKLTAAGQLELRALHSPDSRMYFMIASTPDIASVAGLKGKNYAIARPGSLDQTMTQPVFSRAGLGANDVKFVGVGDPDVRAQALVAHRVDATTVSIGTWVNIQNEKGVKVLVNTDDYFAAAPIIVKVDAVTPAVLRDKQEQLRRFTTAILKTSRYFATNQQAWVDAMMKARPEMKRDDLAGLWGQFKTSWAVNGEDSLDQYQKTADFLYQGDDFKDVPKIPVQNWTDTQILNSVLKTMGVDPSMDPPGRLPY